MIGLPWPSSCQKVTMRPQDTSPLTVALTLESVFDAKATILSKIVHCRLLTIKKEGQIKEQEQKQGQGH
jgi:hypothetical protein